ncbi:MAG: CpaF family protein [Actinomycetota bacterium]
MNGAALRGALHRRLLDGPVDPAALDPVGLRAHLVALAAEEAPLIGADEAQAVIADLVAEVGGLGPLEPLLADPTVTEVMVNGPDRVYVERGGRIERVPGAIDAATIVRIAERVVAPLGLRLDRSAPMVDARLTDGSRLHAVLPPLAIDGPCLTIRRFGRERLPLSAFGIDGAAVALLEALVRAGWNIVVAGATGSGQTTCAAALARAFAPDERIVTIEETAELRLARPHVVRLEARPPNAEGAGAVAVRELVRAALRMRPDRIVVGEVRGAEALDMLQACNTGHDGSLSTVHANSPLDALARIETLALMSDVALPLGAVRAQIAGAIDMVVQVARGRDGHREITGLAEVTAGRTLGVRILAQRVDGVFRFGEPPRRPARRPGRSPREVWRACVRSSSG